MESKKHEVRLTSAELANLWTQYMNDSMAICIFKYSLEKVKDNEIRSILEFALKLAESHVEVISEFLDKEGFIIPKGFTEEDINFDAPPLFSDTFMLIYLHVMTLHGLTGYAGAIGTSTRSDQRSYFIKCNNQSMELYNMVMDLMLNKGINSRPPFIYPPDEIDFVKKQSYLAGWFGKKRPLNAIEISGISFNMQKTVVKIVLEMGFSQAAQSTDVRKYFQRGMDLCKQHFHKFSSLMSKENMSSPRSWESEVTNSTIAPFSDKLMLFHIQTLVSASIGFYGAGLAVSQRRDISLTYTRLLAEIALYAEDGAELLIKNGWLEQPPLAEDREELANEK